MPTVKELTSLVLTLTTKLDAALGTIKVLGDKVGKLEELVSNNSEEITSIMPPSVKDDHSPALDTISSLSAKVNKLEVKLYSNDDQTGLEDEITFIEMENLYPLQTKVDGIEQRIKLLESKGSTAQTCNPPVIPPNSHPTDITQLQKEVLTISEQMKVIQTRDSSSNLVLYGVPETEKSNKELSATVARVAIDLLHMQFTYSGISTSRIGDRNITSKRPRPVRIHFHDPSDRNDFWKRRTLFKSSPFAVSEDLTRRERIQRSIIKFLATSQGAYRPSPSPMKFPP